MTINHYLKKTSDVLQYVIPAAVGLCDVWENNSQKECLQKICFISLLILAQNRGVMVIKKIAKKPRPSFPDDHESFPSGHMMIATTSLTRIVSKYGFFSRASYFTAIGSLLIGAGRYFPGMHDFVDLTVGGTIGIGLGLIWNYGLKQIS